MTDDAGGQTQFEKFAVEIQNFQKTLYSLVASSFFFSAISSIAQGSHIAQDPALAAATTLFGTVAGSAGVLTTYTAWSRHPSEVFTTTMRFSPRLYRQSIVVQFGVSLVAMYCYYLVANTGNALSLFASISLGSFFFFRALVMSALVAKTIEEQANTWKRMTVEERVSWLQSEHEREKLLNQAERSLDASDKSLGEAMRKVDELVDTVSEMERRHRQAKRQEFFDRIHDFTVRVRKAVAGKKFLTSSEIAKGLRDQAAGEEFLDSFEREHAKKIYDDIVSKQIEPIPIEGSDFEFFQQGVSLIAIIKGNLDQASAATLRQNLEHAKNLVSIANAQFLLFVSEGTVLTAQSRRELGDARVKICRIGRWSTP